MLGAAFLGDKRDWATSSNTCQQHVPSGGRLIWREDFFHPEGRQTWVLPSSDGLNGQGTGLVAWVKESYGFISVRSALLFAVPFDFAIEPDQSQRPLFASGYRF